MALPTFVGSFWVGMTLSFSYVATNSTKENRVVRFLTLEIAFFFALAVGNLLGGQLLKRQSWIGGNELRNYSATFLIGIVCSIISMVWTIFRIKNDTIVDDETKIIENENLDDANINFDGANEDGNESRKILSNNLLHFIFIDVLNPKRVIDSFKAIVAKRKPGLRVQIILLMSAHIAIQLEQIGMWKIMFNYTQRMYYWNFEMFSFVSVIATLTGPIVTMIAIPFLSRVMKLSDIEMGLVGTVSMILATTCAGAILTPIGFYLRILFGSMGNAANIAIRSKMSKIIESNEATKIFAAMTTIEVTCPFIAAVLYTNVYNATIATYPSLFIQMSTASLLVPFFIFIFIDLKYERTFDSVKNKGPAEN